jgi:hypothetical protein
VLLLPGASEPTGVGPEEAVCRGFSVVQFGTASMRRTDGAGRPLETGRVQVEDHRDTFVARSLVCVEVTSTCYGQSVMGEICLDSPYSETLLHVHVTRTQRARNTS